MPELPSPFAMKLRKHIRTKRLEDVRQLGEDRVVDFKFGSGDSINHIILEMYANGNIVLTDANYMVLALLRSHQFAEDVTLNVNEVYPIVYATNINTSTEIVTSTDPAADSTDPANDTEHTKSTTVSTNVLSMTPDAFRVWATAKLIDITPNLDTLKEGAVPVVLSNNQKKKSNVRSLNARQLLLSQDSGVSHYGPEVLDHCLLSADVKPSQKLDAFLKLDSAVLQTLIKELVKGQQLLIDMSSPTVAHLGYIVLKDQPKVATPPVVNDNEQEVKQPMVEFAEFVSHLFAQHKDKQHLEFPSFNEAVDEYYCKIEEQKLQRGAHTAEETARKKIEKVKNEQEQKLRGLEQQQSRMEQSAMLLELYAEDVEKVMLVVNSAMGSGMAWEDIEKMVSAEQKAGNPIALLIARLRLERNHVVLRLKNLYVEDNTEGDTEESAQKEEMEEGENSDSESDNDNESEKIASPVVESAPPPLPPVPPPVPVAAKKNVAMNMFDSDSEEDEEEASAPPQAPPTTSVSAPVAPAPASAKQIESLATKGKANKTKKNTPKFTSKTPTADLYLEVEIDLNLSAHANARSMYSNKKSARVKEIKTIDMAQRVMESVEAQTLKQLESQKIKKNLLATRKVHWFEKFNWFLTSEGYLVLSGRDAQQNELLFKRYLRQGDVYVHADLSGASSCIVRAKAPVVGAADTTDSPSKTPSISPLAIQEAGIMAVCRSLAWTAKVMTSAWWVWASQVSKTAPSGEYLTTGSFMIYGKKNFLPPMALEMGFGLMFRLDDSCVARHLTDRKDRDYLNDLESVSMLSDNFDRYAIDGFKVNEATGGLVEGDDDEEDEEEVEEEVNEEVRGTRSEEVEESGALKKLKQKLVKPVESESATLSDSDSDGENDDDQHTAIPKLTERTLLEGIEEQSGSESDGEGPKPTSSIPATGSVHGLEYSQIESNVEKQVSKAKQMQQRIASDPSDNNNNNKSSASVAGSVNGDQVAKKKLTPLNKKKARRYAEQDDEDRELAMLILGHSSSKDGEKLTDKLAKNEKIKQQSDLKTKQDKAGIRYVKDDWSTLMALQHTEVQSALQDIITQNILKEGEIDAYEMKTLAAFPVDRGLEILTLFCDEHNENTEHSINVSFPDAATTSNTTHDDTLQHHLIEVEEGGASQSESEGVKQGGVEGAKEPSRRDRKKAEQREILEILQEEGALDEEAGRQADDLEKIT
eukprot:gene26390-32964_t